MKAYTKTYLNFFDYAHSQDTFIPCEYCASRAVDIHHIKGRGMGGSKCCSINDIYNLIALCRQCHITAENNKEFNKKLKILHIKNVLKKLEDNE